LATLGVLIIFTIASVGWVPPFADEECGRLLRGVSVVVSQNMRIGLQEESNVGVAAMPLP
jgi:hypothetical protein